MTIYRTSAAEHLLSGGDLTTSEALTPEELPMWVTQTYLGNVEPEAHLFIYYLFEDYNSQQSEFTKAVQRQLEVLGEVYGDQVSLLMPNPRYAGGIEAEVREFPKLWMAVRELLPGLLVSPVPFTELLTHPQKCTFIPFRREDAQTVAKVIQRVRGRADAAIAGRQESEAAKPSFFSRFLDAIEVKPGIWGIRLDLKKLAETW